jgi:hypothetical protein
MKPVIIEMDQCFTWWPRDFHEDDILENLTAVYLSDEFLAEFEEVSKKYHEFQRVLEKEFRSQQGLSKR